MAEPGTHPLTHNQLVSEGRHLIVLKFHINNCFLSLSCLPFNPLKTALHIAVQKNHHLIASDLLSLGADVNARDDLQKTALHLCAEKGYLRVLEVSVF